MSRKKITSTPLAKKYPKSEAVKMALLKNNEFNPKLSVCEHDRVDYKAMVRIANNSTKVMDNLAKAIVSLEYRINQNEELYSGWLKTANDLNNKLNQEISELKKRLEVMKYVN
jgi:predicted transcriptional regulator